jgi:hypothetical protein
MGRNLSPYMPGLLFYGNPAYMTPESVTVPSQYCMLPGDFITSDNGAYAAMVLDNGLFAMYHAAIPTPLSEIHFGLARLIGKALFIFPRLRRLAILPY